MSMEPNQSIRGRKQSNIRNCKKKKLRKTLKALFIDHQSFILYLIKRGVNRKKIHFLRFWMAAYTKLDGDVGKTFPGLLLT